MIQVKRNSHEFKTIQQIFDEYEGTGKSKRSIKLYALKPFEALDKRILINDLKENKDAIYALTYDTLLDYLRLNKSKKLFRESPGLYFLKAMQKVHGWNFLSNYRQRLKNVCSPWQF